MPASRAVAETYGGSTTFSAQTGVLIGGGGLWLAHRRSARADA
jgi:hypothetical protein